MTCESLLIHPVGRNEVEGCRDKTSVLGGPCELTEDTVDSFNATGKFPQIGEQVHVKIHVPTDDYRTIGIWPDDTCTHRDS